MPSKRKQSNASDSGEDSSPENVDVDFVFKSATQNDFDSVFALIRQLLGPDGGAPPSTTNMDLFELTDTVVGYDDDRTTVIKVDVEADDAMQEEGTDPGSLCAFFSTLDFGLDDNKTNKHCGLLPYLCNRLETTKHGAYDKYIQIFKTHINSVLPKTAIVFYDRFVNVPAQVFKPLLDITNNEIFKPRGIEQIIFISRTYTSPHPEQDQDKQQDPEQNDQIPLAEPVTRKKKSKKQKQKELEQGGPDEEQGEQEQAYHPEDIVLEQFASIPPAIFDFISQDNGGEKTYGKLIAIKRESIDQICQQLDVLAAAS